MKIKLKLVFVVGLALLMLTSCNLISLPDSSNNSSNSGSSESSEEPRPDFIIDIYSDKTVYKENEKIEIWATLKYVGFESDIKIWHGEPYIGFSITDGGDFNTSTMISTVLTSSTLKKNELYNFNYVKSGSYDESSPDKEFWKNFYKEKDLYLPKGEYTIKVRGDFALSDDVLNDKVDLSKEIKIIVE